MKKGVTGQIHVRVGEEAEEIQFSRRESARIGVA